MTTESEADFENDDTIEYPSHDEHISEESYIEQIERERDELKETVLRKTAEFENFRRRTLKEKQEIIDYGNEHLIMKMLPVVDDLHAALDAAKKNVDYEGFLKGVEMIYSKALKTFEEAGVCPIPSVTGELFNVDMHEALAHIPSPETPEGYIIQEIQRGFKLKEKVIRHSRVITSAGSQE